MIYFLPVVIALFVFMYHYERNGDPENIGDFFSRMVWAASFGAGYVLLGWPHISLLTLAWFIVFQFVAMLVPHAFAQQMGTRHATWAAVAPWTKYWPGLWVLWLFGNASYFVQDFLGMATTGLIRGAIVFLPTLFFGSSLAGALFATVLTLAWQPLSYTLGYKTPWTLWTNAPRSSAWGGILHRYRLGTCRGWSGVSLTYKKERFKDIMPELPELFYANWTELESNHDTLPLDVDWLRYLQAEATGKLHILTARDGSKLVGYFFCYVDTTAQNKNIKKAASDVVYLLPEHRKGTEGWRFIDQVLSFSRDLGAKQLYISHKVKAGLAPLLERKGMALEEQVHTCLL